MTDSEKCPYGLYEGKYACSNRMDCLTAGEPKCKDISSGSTIVDYLRRELWIRESQK